MGWALFDDNTLVLSGTIEPEGKRIATRLAHLFIAIKDLSTFHKPDEMIFERMNRVVNVMVIWAVGVIVAAYEAGTFGEGSTSTNGINYQVSPPTWKKYDRDNKAYNGIRKNTASDDETVAVLIGLAYLEKLDAA